MKSSWRSYGKVCVLRLVRRTFLLWGDKDICNFGNSATFAGRLHCLADAVTYSGLSGTDMDIEVEACLVYGTSEDGGVAEHNKIAAALWQAYLENRD